LLCLFDSVDHALAMQATVYGEFPNLPPDDKHFAQQFVVDKDGEFIRYCGVPDGACGMDIDDLYMRVQELGG